MNAKMKKWIAAAGVIFVHLAIIAIFFGGMQAVINHLQAAF
ncbi:MAG: hypothetical protein OEZ02_01030 [Anaerolineae bacterium]|nr:hypothetical protein [Anaerolineae bacterium]